MERYSKFLFILLVAAALPHGQAQEFFGSGVSARTAARANVYVPSPDDPLDALALNPAGLSSIATTVVDLSATGLAARGHFSNAANTESPMRRTLGAVPYGAIGIPLGSRWTVAAGLIPDLMSAAKWQFQDAPGVAGASYGAQQEKSEILAWRIAGGFAFRASSKLSFGMTVSSVYNSNTLQMPYVFQSHPALQGLKTLLDLHTTGRGWSTSYGVVAHPSRRWLVSVAYRSGTAITSSGHASGNMGAQFRALGIPFQPNFAYKAQVQVDLPQSALLGLTWQKSSVSKFGVQSKWTGWKSAFKSLPVDLTEGTNQDINGFVRSTSIKDEIPVHWKDQFTFSTFAERQMTEMLSLSGGVSHRSNPVPSSTLSPLTAAIPQDGVSAGIAYRRSRVRFDLAYQFGFAATQSVRKSSLLSGEFDRSTIRVGMQAITLTTSFTRN